MIAGQKSFDVVVIGGGHAGCEAASATARMGASTALVTGRLPPIRLRMLAPLVRRIGMHPGAGIVVRHHVRLAAQLSPSASIRT